MDQPVVLLPLGSPWNTTFVPEKIMVRIGGILQYSQCAELDME